MFFYCWVFVFVFYFILLYNTVLVLPYINMNPPRVYMSSQSWTLLPPPSPYHLSGSSQCTTSEHPVSCIEPGLSIHFTYDIIHVSMPFSQIIPPSPSPSESKSPFYTSVSLLLSRIEGYHYHLSKFHIYVLVYCIGVFLSGLHNGVLLSHQKEYIWISSNEVDETGAGYTEWSKPEKKHQYSILTHIYGI